MKKLIVIRGNSGSGKTTLAKKLREKIKSNSINSKVAVINQDDIRRKMLDEKGVNGTIDNVKLIELSINFCLESGYTTIVEGILNTEVYQDMFKRVIASADQYHLYYLDISFNETLQRHNTKREDVKNAFGENEMRQWYKEKDFLELSNEITISETLSLEESLEKIYREVI